MKNFFITLGYAALGAVIIFLFVLAIAMVGAAILNTGYTIINY